MEKNKPAEPPSAEVLPGCEPQTDSYSATLSLICPLPDAYQLPVRLHAVEKKSYAEIARQLGLSEGTIKSQISRGQKKLQQLLEQEALNSENGSDREHQEDPDIFSEEQIAKLPAKYQNLVRLYCISRKTYTEIANQLNLPKGTVKSYINRGCKMLNHAPKEHELASIVPDV